MESWHGLDVFWVFPFHDSCVEGFVVESWHRLLDGMHRFHTFAIQTVVVNNHDYET